MKISGLLLSCLAIFFLSAHIAAEVPSTLMTGTAPVPSMTPTIKPAPIVSGLLWKTKQIPVCWLNPEADKDHLGIPIVKGAIRGSWQKYADIEFVWTDNCRPINEVTSPEIRIFIADDKDRSYSHIGTEDWSFSNGQWDLFHDPKSDLQWKTETMFLSLGDYYNIGRRKSLRFTAIHEFGHALGFLHEQDGTKVPNACLDKLAQRDVQSILDIVKFRNYYWSYGIVYADYDTNSVMNYCREPDPFDDHLSQYDIELVQYYYSAKKMPDIPGSYFTISNPEQTECLTLTGQDKLALNGCNHGENQLWFFRYNSDRSFNIAGKPSANKYLSLTKEDAAAVQDPSSQTSEFALTIGSSEENMLTWIRTPHGNKNYIFQLSRGALVMDQNTANKDVERPVLLKKWNGQDQVWRVKRVKNHSR